MEKVTLEILARRALSDPVFRNHLLVDPMREVTDAGWDLPKDDLLALQAWHANLRDVSKLEELERALAEFLASREPHG